MNSLDPTDTGPNRGNFRLLFAGVVSIAICSGLAGAFIATDQLVWPIPGSLAVILLAGLLWRFRKSQRAAPSQPATTRSQDDSLKLSQVAESRLQDVVDSISDGFVLWDKDNRLLLHNRRATRHEWPHAMTGISFDQYVVDTFPLLDDRTTGGDPQKWLQKRHLWRSEANHSHEVLAKDGTWSLLTERRTPDGGTVTIYTNITEAKNNERILANSERRLAHAQTLARIGIFEWDASRSEMYWSDIMYEIVGLPTDSPPLDLSQYMLLVRPESRDLVGSTFRRLLTCGGKYNHEYEIVRPDGEIRAVRTEI